MTVTILGKNNQAETGSSRNQQHGLKSTAASMVVNPYQTLAVKKCVGREELKTVRQSCQLSGYS